MLKINHDEDFKPTFINTALFLFSLISQSCIFLFNHGGEPHMEGFSKHKKFFRFLIAMVVFSLIFSLNYLEDFNSFFELEFTDIDYAANE